VAAIQPPLPALDESDDVSTLGIRERCELDEAAHLPGIVVYDGSLEMLARGCRLAQLAAKPAEEADGCLIRHGEQAIRVAPDGSLPLIVIMRRVKEILPEIEAWKRDGEKVVVATVVATRRSAPRPIGASLAISESGKMCGSVSGGCVESDVFENAQEVFATGEPKLLSYGIDDDVAWSVGLPCGGEIDVFVEPVE
jgi:xanthine dehydrogenase accessory factor